MPMWPSRQKKPDNPPKVTPQTPTAAVLSRQREIGKRSRGPFTMWLWRGGWLLFVAFGAVVVTGVLVLGPAVAGEILIGVTSPYSPHVDAWIATVRWVLALTGWLVVPAVVGALVGYFVGVAMGSYRSRTLDEIASNERPEGE